MDNVWSKKPLSVWAEREEKILSWWKEQRVFEKTLQQNSPKGEYIFYEGPPTANGRPGLHHILSRAFKDALPRYKTMQGHHVRRKAGWDTHGLPVELEVEKKLNLKSKKEIEEYGIQQFNEECRASVWHYVDEWRAFTERMGYWIDLNDPYVTYHADYIESVWSIVKIIQEKKLLYKDYKVVPWCPRCGTALSSHELAQGYADVKDLSVTVAFPVKGEEQTFLLAWTTTPWTLIGNVALAVGKDIDYVYVQEQKEDGSHAMFILAQDRVADVFKDRQYRVVKTVKGRDLVGLSYEPIFPYFLELAQKNNITNKDYAFYVYDADFVTTTDGTGIVHTAVMYGQDDFQLGTEKNLPKMHVVSAEGMYMPNIGEFSGKFAKDPDVAVDIVKSLAYRGFLFSKQKYEHSYPHCWRCKTPLIYYARDSWYISMQSVKENLITENQQIHWQPEHIRDGRFGEWLKDVKDWAISRERYWGTPLPIWEDEQGQPIIIGSYEELRKYTVRSGNTYQIMRHGQAVKNKEGVIASTNIENPLTSEGKDQVKKTLEKINKPDIIFVSPFQRAQETAKMVQEHFHLSVDALITDERLREIGMGTWEGKSWDEFHKTVTPQEHLDHSLFHGESRNDVKKRIGDFLYEIESRYQGKNILIVTHGGCITAFRAVAEGAGDEKYLHMLGPDGSPNVTTAGFIDLDFVPLPHNQEYELDPHRPFIDLVQLEKEGKPLRRVSEVMDVWFDSGAMPLAQDHILATSDQVLQNYPADFISEAIDQTRGWFYTLHAIGNLLGKGKAYHNVICLGHILDASGQKMSKSKGNTINPWDAMSSYGIDTIRLWMYSVNQPGEAKNFDEKNVLEVQRKILGLLDNVVKFYELHPIDPEQVIDIQQSSSILDQWIIAEWNRVHAEITEHLEHYQLMESVRLLRDFIADLSQWYVRRSRDRVKISHPERLYARGTLHFILHETAKVLAVFAPFFAEDVYRRLTTNGESVHQQSWSTVKLLMDAQRKILDDMSHVRELISRSLELRARAKIKIRQPLASVTLNARVLEQYFIDLIKEEVNVHEVIFSDHDELDVRITPVLQEEGDVRELIRTVQELRKQHQLRPEQHITLYIYAEEIHHAFFEKAKTDLENIAQVKYCHILPAEEKGELCVIRDRAIHLVLQSLHEENLPRE